MSSFEPGSAGRRQQLRALRALVGRSPVRWWALAVLLNRLPAAMAGLALILAGERATGSLADGALLVAASALGFAVAAPWRGRALDRVELRGGLQRDCGLAAASTAALAVAVLAGAPLWALVALSVAVGVASAGLEGGFRALLPTIVPPGEVSRGSALEAVLGEVTFLAGPALAGLIAHVAGAVTALGVMAAGSLSAALIAARLPRRPPAPPVTRPGGRGRRRSGRRQAVWRLPGVGAVYVLAVGAGGCVGLLESAMPARVALLGLPAPAAGGYLTAAYTASLLGGVVATATAPSDVALGARRAPVHALALFGWLGGGLAATALVGSPAGLAAAAMAAGLALAPLYALGALVLQSRLPPARHAEGFAVFIAAQAVGAGLGNAVTSQLLGRAGPVGLLALGSGLALVAAAAMGASRLTAHRSAASRSRHRPRP